MQSLLKMSFFRKLILLGIFCVAPLSSQGSAPTNPSGFIIRRGVNLSHWLSQDFGWKPRSTWITEQDFRYIASIGYDHVRLPLDEKELWSTDGKPNETAFALVEKALDWSAANKLRVIVDLHTINAHHFNAENEGLKNTLFSEPASQLHFLALWKELSARLKKHPVNQVAYEILNEPVADNNEDWNKLIARCLTQLRVDEPQRVVILGANRWQIPQNVPYLKPPAGDKNIILSTHTYAPFAFTHHLADWTPLKIYTGPVQYPGSSIPSKDHAALLNLKNQNLEDLLGAVGEVWNKDRLAKELAPAILHAKQLGLQLYCGEFGCLPTVPRQDRLAYYRDIVAVFEESDMAFANWEYKGDFGIFEWHGQKNGFDSGAPDVDLIKALLSHAGK